VYLSICAHVYIYIHICVVYLHMYTHGCLNRQTHWDSTDVVYLHMYTHRCLNRQTHWDSTDENDDNAHVIYLSVHICIYIYTVGLHIYAHG